VAALRSGMALLMGVLDDPSRSLIYIYIYSSLHSDLCINVRSLEDSDCLTVSIHSTYQRTRPDPMQTKIYTVSDGFFLAEAQGINFGAGGILCMQYNI
jgi:hypothetical protein